MDSTYHLGDFVYMRYQSDASGNRGKVIAIKETGFGTVVEYTIETPMCTHFYGLYDEQLTPYQTRPATINDAVRVLNEILKADQVAITNLVEHRVDCNPALENHPTVQIAGPEDCPQVGLLGVLNGILEPMTGHRIMAVYDDSDQKIVEFKVYQPQP